jgi:hypothetical protein
MSLGCDSRFQAVGERIETLDALYAGTLTIETS